MFGCDYVEEQQQEEVSLKGEKVTSEFRKELGNISGCCSKSKSSLEVYSVNTKSPKAEEVKKRVKSTLKKFSNEDSGKKTSSIQDPTRITEPDMENSLIVENTKKNREVLVTPLDNGMETISQRVYIPYDSETNSVSSQMFFYSAETNLSASEINALETNPDLADRATVHFEIKDQDGNTLYSKELNKAQYDNAQFKSNTNSNISGCFGSCFETVVRNLPWYQYIICAIKPIPCVIGISITCGMHCWVYDGRYL